MKKKIIAFLRRLARRDLVEMPATATPPYVDLSNEALRIIENIWTAREKARSIEMSGLLDTLESLGFNKRRCVLIEQGCGQSKINAVSDRNGVITTYINGSKTVVAEEVARFFKRCATESKKGTAII